MPRLCGVHVPNFVAAGDFAVQPYIVMERISGNTLLPAAARAPFALCRSRRHRRENRRRAGRSASAACDSPRRQAKQYHVSADRRGRSARFRIVASRPASRSDAGGISAAFWHRAVHVARAIARHSQRSEKRPVCSGCSAVFLFDGCTSLRRKRDDVWNAPSALARSGSSAPIEARLSAVAARNRLALPRDRAGMALSDRGATCVRLEPSRPSQTHQEIRATGARSAGHRSAAALQQGHHQIDHFAGDWRGKSLRPRLSRSPSISTEGSPQLNDALRVTAERILTTLPSARLACLNVLKLGRITLDFTLDEQGHNKRSIVSLR